MSHGHFAWYELMTNDTAAAEAFYSRVIGWEAKDAGMPDMAYTIFSASAAPVAGMMKMPQDACDMGAQPGWLGYVAVDDCDASAARVTELGGAVLRPADDVPGVGRFAVVADPQGAVFILFTPSGEMDSPPPPKWAPGTGGWHELLAADAPAVWDFYAGLFGWEKTEAVDMGEMGVYQLFGFGKEAIGGLFSKPPFIPQPFWQFYFCTDDIDAAVERVKTAGGAVTTGPMEVPGGAWIINCADPEGVVFAMVGSRGA